MKAYKILTIALATALMSSCGVYKSYERPASVTAEGIYGDAQSGGDTGLGDIEWRQVFTDPTLQSLIEKALAQNTNMKQADLRIQEMQNNLKSARLAFAPSFAFAPSGTISGIVDPYDRDKYQGIMGNGASKTYAFPLSMSWQIDCFASLRNSKKKAEVALESQKSVRQSVKTALIANVANLYYTLAMLDEQLRIATETSETWKKNVDMTKMLFDAGQANQAAVASAEANYWSISTSMLDLQNNIKQVENSISTLCGETPSHIERGTLATFRTPAVCTTGLPIGLLSRRPDVKQAELALASAFYNKNIAKAAFYPALNISASGQYSNSISGLGVVNPGGGHNDDENNGDDGNNGNNGGSGNKSGNGKYGENGNSGGSGYNGGGESLNGAAGEKVYATASASPKTGDNTNLLARWFALFAAAVVLAVTARKLYRKEKDR